MDDDMDMGKLPNERRFGPEPFLSDMEGEGPSPPGPGKEPEPLPFAEPALPKGGGDRFKEIKDRRRREMEELTEEVSEEKWGDMMNRIHTLEEKVEEMTTSVKSASTEIAGPGAPPMEIDSIRKDIETQKHTIEDANARIDSLEEVVKGSLTPMVESIKKFSHAVKTAKGDSLELPKPVQAAPPAEPQPTEQPSQPEKPE
jgi:hypothetical protein